MGMIFVYDDTPLPVGNPINMNGQESYELGFADGGLHSEQYADQPEEGIGFSSPDDARRWLEAMTEVLTPYIESGDRQARVPNPDGWDQP